MPIEAGRDPEITARFLVEIDGIQLGSCEEYTGYKGEWAEGSDGRSGTDPIDENHSYTGRLKHEPITIKKMLRSDASVAHQELEAWFKSGSGDRRTVSLVTLDREGNEIRRRNLYGAYVKAYNEPDQKASDEAEALIDEVTISFRKTEIIYS